ncbi:MAG TPA: hypothetical protein DDZ80_15120 [Cyanobacteria bacterium UBA8803]|nr:hypothetical protein [Cyanobacteria bacterium UBA9273]HBL59752.1 hypothetical protein [Cyanobacteria bacterium UBA8803]
MARYALVIGIAEYDSSSLPTLKQAATDAEAVAQLLEQSGNFQEVIRLPRRWLKDKNCYEIAPKKVTGEEVAQELQQFLLLQAANHEALIYFAGHGFQVSSPMGVQKGYLATSNCGIDGRHAIPLDEFNLLIGKSNLSTLVVLLDCCQSGSLLERSLLEPTLKAFDTKPDYYFITACRSFEKAYEGAEHGIFTGAVLKGLSPENADKDGLISSDRLFDHIRRELKGSGQEPIRMGRGRSIPLVTYQNANPAIYLPSVSESQEAQITSPVSRAVHNPRNPFLKKFGIRHVASASLILLLGATVLAIPQVRTGLRLDKPSCFKQAHQKGKLVIAIADFDENEWLFSRRRHTLEERLRSELRPKIQDYAEVCLLEGMIKNGHEQARELGSSLGAAAVIWAKLESPDFFVGISVVGSQLLDYNFDGIPSSMMMDEKYIKFRTETFPQLVSMTTKRTLCEIEYRRGNVESARINLASYLEESNRPDLSEEDKKERAKDYLLQGLLFETSPNDNAKAARKSYENALKLNPELDLAQFKVAEIYEQLGEIKEAIAAFEKLRNSPSLAEMAFLRLGDLYNNQSNPDKAIEAFKEAIQLNPISGYLALANAYLNYWHDVSKAMETLQDALNKGYNDPNIYRFLGLFQLQSNQPDTAKKTYQKGLCYIKDNYFRDAIIEDLNSLGKKNQNQPNLIKIINEIDSMIKQSPIPQTQNC